MLNINTWAPLFEVIKKREKLKVKFTVHINGTQRFRIWNGYVLFSRRWILSNQN